MLGGDPVARRSKQQTVVTESTKKAEFVALTSCVWDVLWTRKLHLALDGILESKFLKEHFDIRIMEDNQACIQVLCCTQ